jgi:hypothetical protein
MTVLTETLIDVADRHTTLYYLGSPPARHPLPFANSKGYRALHRRLADRGRMDYGDVTPGRASAILGYLKPAYAPNGYWRRYLGAWSYTKYAYPDLAWAHLLPILGVPTRRVEVVLDPRLSLKVSPLPRILLYPFGWSTWLSLRVLGPHSIADLAALLGQLFGGNLLRFDGELDGFTLSKLFDAISGGVRAEAFGGDRTSDFDSQDVAVVVTVIAKYSGSPSLGALGTTERTNLRRIVRPYGPPPGGSFDEHVYRLQPGDDLEYLVYDNHGRFLWIEHLLEPFKSEQRALRCYHNNTFMSLVQAWHLHGLLVAVAQQNPLSSTAFNLTKFAIPYLESPPYRCASLVQFLQGADVKAALAKAITLHKSATRKPRSKRPKRKTAGRR